MAVELEYPMDEIDQVSVMAAGWTHLELFYSSTIEGPYVTTGIRSLLVLNTFVYTITAASPTYSHWFKMVLWNGTINSDLNAASPFHGGAGTLLTALRREVGKLTRDMLIGTASENGSTTTIVTQSFPFMRFPDGDFAGYMFFNPATGQNALISSAVKTAGATAKFTLTFAPSVTSTVAGDVFEITKRWSRAEYLDAINWALDAAYPVLSRPIINTSLLTADDLRQLRVPNDIKMVAKVEVESSLNATSTSQAVRGHPYREVAFTPMREGLLQFLEFKHDLPFSPDPRRVRISGTGVLSHAYNEGDSVEIINPTTQLLAALAASRLYQLLPNTASPSDREFYVTQAGYYLSMYNSLKTSLGPGRLPKRVWGPDAAWSKAGAP